MRASLGFAKATIQTKQKLISTKANNQAPCTPPVRITDRVLFNNTMVSRVVKKDNRLYNENIFQ
jgi:hypothetical protein